MRSVQTRLGEEVGRETNHGARAAEGLNCPDESDDFCTTEIHAFETVPVVGSREVFFLELVGVNHHRDSGIRIEVGLASRSQTQQLLLRVVITAFSDKPPWTFWSQRDTNDQRHRPDPLQGIRQPEANVAGLAADAFQDGRREELSNNPAEVDIGRKVRAKRYRTNFGCIRCRKRLESSPRDSAEDLELTLVKSSSLYAKALSSYLSDQEHWQISCKE